MQRRSRFVWVPPLFGLGSGVLAGALVPLPSPSEGAERARVDAVPSGSSEQRVAPRAEGGNPADDAPAHVERRSYPEQRRAFIVSWGRPPMPTSPDQPTEGEVQELLEGLTDGVIRAVDCWTYPCVAVILNFERDDGLRDRLRETWPHAIVNGGPMHARVEGERVTGHISQVALLDAPVEPRSREWHFTGRLLEALRHRTSEGNYELLREHFSGTESDAPRSASFGAEVPPPGRRHESTERGEP